MSQLKLFSLLLGLLLLLAACGGADTPPPPKASLGLLESKPWTP